MLHLQFKIVTSTVVLKDLRKWKLWQTNFSSCGVKWVRKPHFVTACVLWRFSHARGIFQFKITAMIFIAFQAYIYYVMTKISLRIMVTISKVFQWITFDSNWTFHTHILIFACQNATQFHNECPIDANYMWLIIPDSTKWTCNYGLIVGLVINVACIR